MQFDEGEGSALGMLSVASRRITETNVGNETKESAMFRNFTFCFIKST